MPNWVVCLRPHAPIHNSAGGKSALMKSIARVMGGAKYTKLVCYEELCKAEKAELLVVP